MTLSEAQLVVRHVGDDDIPWVDTGIGVELKILRIDKTHGTWVIRNRFQPGVQLQIHKHTGTVDGYTLSGRWHYLEYDFVSVAGSYIHGAHRRPVRDRRLATEPHPGRPGRVHDRR
jgi:2,4'-dihydroxyacetophenone dioxygenase